MDYLLEMHEIVKEFPGVLANDRVNFNLRAGETHALVGENGAGKSTLMKILYGQYRADSGRILIEGTQRNYGVADARELGIGMVHQNFMQITDMSIVENVILGNAPGKAGFVNYKEAHRRVGGWLERFGMRASPNTPIKSLSVGERQKVEIVKTLFFNAKILILDEPTAVLTPQESQELFRIIEDLKDEGCSIVFISHKLREVITVGDRISVMRRGQMVESSLMRGEVNETDIARAMIGKQDVQLIRNARDTKIGKKLLDVRHLWYFDEQGVAKVKDLSFSVNGGEVLGVGGVEGNGQTELIKLLIGLLEPAEGNILLEDQDVTNKNVADRRASGFGYISDDRMTEGLVIDGTMQDNIICGEENDPKFSRYGLLKKREIAAYCEDRVEEFDIKGVRPEKEVRMLSGGNMQKIVLAREIGRSPKVLIAAQPTRGLDIGAINFVRTQLLAQREEGKGIILISADLEELMSLSDRMIILYEGGCSGEIVDVEHVTEERIGLLMGGVAENEQQEGTPNADTN